MKTRDRILKTSLLLFNEEGEQNVTTVDIANEMDISPGNLYYHFRGKESIIDALYEEYETVMLSLLYQGVSEELSVEDHWYFIYVIFEEIYKFRFFFLNLGDILQRYPELERRFKRLIKNKVNTIEALSLQLIEKEAIQVNAQDISQLAENISFTLLYWFPFQQLLHADKEPAEIIHSGVYHVLSLVIPFADAGQTDWADALSVIYESKT